MLSPWQGEILGMRVDHLEADEDDYTGSLYFDDGGMRGLSAAVCWIGLTYRCTREPAEELRHPSLKQLVSSLLCLPSIHKTQTNDPAMAMVQRIIKQNVDAKKLPVSSFEWSQILSKIAKNVSVADAIKLYNNAPEVHAHGGCGSSKDPLGAKVTCFRPGCFSLKGEKTLRVPQPCVNKIQPQFFPKFTSQPSLHF